MSPLKHRKATVFMAFAVVAGLVAVFVVDAPSGVPPVEAQPYACKAPNSLCNGGLDTTKTATLQVVHQTSSATPVEPDSGESWTVKAYWNTNMIPCAERTETASVDVDWNGSQWVVSNKSTTSNILDFTVCDTDDGCRSGGNTHDYKYQLAADITDPVDVSGINFNLRQVVFTASSIDDGYELNLGTCALGNSVSPTVETVNQTDSGPFECGFACQSSPPSVTITYQ